MRLLPAALPFAVLLATSPFAQADCAADFAGVMQAYRDAGPRKVETELSFTSSKLAEGNTRTSIARIVLPDALDLHTEDSNTRSQNDAILVGGRGFTRVDGSWKPLPDDAIGELRALFLSDGFMGEQPQSVKCLGSRKVAGKMLDAYSFEIPGAPRPMAVTLYADAATKRPVEAKGLAAVQSGGEDMKVSYIYDPKIKIEAPK